MKNMYTVLRSTSTLTFGQKMYYHSMYTVVKQHPRKHNTVMNNESLSWKYYFQHLHFYLIRSFGEEIHRFLDSWKERNRVGVLIDFPFYIIKYLAP